MWFWREENTALFGKCHYDETEKQVLINVASVPEHRKSLHKTLYPSQWTASTELSPGSDSVWLALSAVSNWWAGLYTRDEWSFQGDIWAAGSIDRCRRDSWASFSHMRKNLVLRQIVFFLSLDQFPPALREILAYNYGFVIHYRNYRTLFCPEDVRGQVSHSYR